MKIKGFTLAEVLITLSILGVVAAISIPNIVQNYKRSVLKTQLKQTFADLEQVSRMFFVLNSTSIPDYAAKIGNGGYFKVFDKIIDEQYIKTRSTKEQNTNKKDFFNSKYKNLLNQPIGNVDANRDGYLKDSKGRDWYAHQIHNKVSVDINGYEKGPNRLGIDVFNFIFEQNGEVSLPAIIYRCQKNSTYSRSGLDCTEYAFKDIKPDDNTKTYWKDFLNSL